MVVSYGKGLFMKSDDIRYWVKKLLEGEPCEWYIGKCYRPGGSTFVDTGASVILIAEEIIDEL